MQAASHRLVFLQKTVPDLKIQVCMGVIMKVSMTKVSLTFPNLSS